MSVLDKFGIGAADVASSTPQEAQYPKQVAGRVAHIDADFMAYQVSAESKEELDPADPKPRKTLEDMKHNAYQAVDHIRMLAAAETAVLHVTHKSDKGGRDSQALLKPYQANRADREKPEHLDTIREFLGDGVADTTGKFTGVKHTDQEADDGMAQAHYADPENAIVCSMDKDLLMVPGWKLNMQTYAIHKCPDSFGHIEIDASKSSKKVIGLGTKFFWAQLLMGDTADNISGLPECPGSMWQYYAGTAAYKDAYAQWIATDDTAISFKLDEKMKKLCAKTKKCGPVLTYELLKDARDDKECYETVKTCYELLAKEHGYVFKDYRDPDRVITPTQALLSEMRLLWMRRYKDKDDVLKWLKEVLND